MTHNSFLLLVLLVGIASGAPLISQKLVDTVNQANSTWQATLHPIFASTSREEFVRGVLPHDVQVHQKQPVRSVSSVGTLPENFDSTVAWPNFIHPILDQGKCGSCWSIAVASAFADRVAIRTNGTLNFMMSPQFLLDCDEGGMGCHGSSTRNPIDPWQYIEYQGIPSDPCYPYTSGQTGIAGECPATCTDGSAMKLFRGASAYRLNPGVEQIQQDMMTYGPLEMDIMLYEDFQTYKGGIYQHVTGELLGQHAMRCVGWGVENQVPFWKCANSYGPSWGEQGFVRIKMGSVGIERSVVAGAPR
eukprot:TRINITY_DN9718_c0_g1_i3.p1 TRINITY_DN9718_c0_g1~~TRINITY_DN9718_c0_g1_i3.p1  ORF type:complete len:323 (+),score=73.39 TRINITY_DN9718_c0_g1_i3:62-970(+)